MAIFQFFCKKCGRRQDHICAFDEIPEQRCVQCSGALIHEFVPTRAKAIIYAQDTPGLNPEWKGPKQRRKWLRERGLVDYDGASADEVDRQQRRDDAHREEVEAESHLKMTHEMLDELGDAGLYTSYTPSRDENLPDPDHTGAGTGAGPLHEESQA